MDSETFKRNFEAVKDIMRMDLTTLSAIELRDLPEGCSYLALLPFAEKTIACYGIELMAPTRLRAVEIALTLFPPAKTSLLAVSPFFRPTATVPNQIYSTPVCPITFNSFYDGKVDDEQGRFMSKLVWYHEPLPEEPRYRLLCGAYIENDIARLTPESFTRYPTGGKIATSERPELQENSATIYWPVETTAEKLIEHLDSIEVPEPDDNEWPDLITEKTQ